MTFSLMLKWQWEQSALLSIEYDRPQFEQTVIFSMHYTTYRNIRTKGYDGRELVKVIFNE